MRGMPCRQRSVEGVKARDSDSRSVKPQSSLDAAQIFNIKNYVNGPQQRNRRTLQLYFILEF